MNTKELINDLNNSKKNLIDMGNRFNIPKIKTRITEIESLMSDSNFWNDISKANILNAELTNLKKQSELFHNLKNRIDSSLEMVNLALEDESLINELITENISIQKEIAELEINTYLNGEYDHLNCYLEVHPGAGGTESCDWAAMLLRMYQMFCDKNNYVTQIIDEQPGEEAGIKSVTLLIKGTNAYGLLKNEQGVHRLVRISPFDSNSRRHTSFASVSITPEFDDKIQIEIKEQDLKVDVYRSSGAGGQSVNTTDSAVRITHLPTKIVVTCQNERSQLKNKEQALHILKNKLYQLELEHQQEELDKIKGTHKDIVFGSQIRSYTLEPYTLVKDHRTNFETTNADKVLDGQIIDFINASLKYKNE